MQQHKNCAEFIVLETIHRHGTATLWIADPYAQGPTNLFAARSHESESYYLHAIY